MIHANKERLGLRERSEKFAGLLAASLSFHDEEVRRWAVLALSSLDDRVLPILRRARLRETSAKVNRELDAVLGNKPAPRAGVTAAECTKRNRKKMMSWPVRKLCDPIGRYPDILFSLGDGTNIYKGRGNGPACFRGMRKKRCYSKCLPGDALIDTPRGMIAVRELHEGALVWSFDDAGKRVAQPIALVGSVLAGPKHSLVQATLSDGRVIRASGPHPTASKPLEDLVIGSRLDGSVVVEILSVPLRGQWTYDLLPQGSTGLYIADGVILGSTL
jgi:hypothetical protein